MQAKLKVELKKLQKQAEYRLHLDKLYSRWRSFLSYTFGSVCQRLDLKGVHTMARQEKEDKKHRQLREKIRKACSELSPWELFQNYLYIKSVVFQHKMTELTLRWLVFQLDFDEKRKMRQNTEIATPRKSNADTLNEAM